jgi:hypothetical protein
MAVKRWRVAPTTGSVWTCPVDCTTVWAAGTAGTAVEATAKDAAAWKGTTRRSKRREEASKVLKGELAFACGER